MFYHALENKYIQEGTSFTIAGVEYPPSWLNLATLSEKAAIGLDEVITVGAPADSRYYWVQENLLGNVRSYINVPKDLDDLKKNFKLSVNTAAWQILNPTDYMDSRRGYEAPADWLSWREAVRAYAAEAKAAIELAKTVPEFAAMAELDWPKDPTYVLPKEPVQPE